MLRFYPLLVPKGGSFHHILKASAIKAPEPLVKEFAILFNRTYLHGLGLSGTQLPQDGMIRYLNEEPSVPERMKLSPARKEHILKLMKDMPETISNWRKERKATKQAAKPKYPY